MNTFSASALRGLSVAICLAALGLPSVAYSQGIALSGVGPVNRAMGGAATAAPIDAAGALLWNPATIGALRNSQIEIAMELLLPTERIDSSIEPGALGGGFPPVRLSGSTTGEPGVAPIPTMAWVHQKADSPFAFGLGMFGIAGFKLNYPSSATNPILTPPPPNGLGLGRLVAEAEYYQIVPTVSFKMSDNWYVGVAPTITLSSLSANPLCLVSPNDANGDGFASYPPGDGSRFTWGGGFQVGVYYVSDAHWQMGLCFKSTQWSEAIRFNTVNELGAPVQDSVHFDYPMIISFGFAYTGFERWLLACDIRYFDYENTDGFGDPATFDNTGRVTGLGWKSIIAVHTGAQYRATERLYLRMGYQYNENPIGSNAAFFNVAAPLSIQHVLSTGFSYQVSCNVLFSMAYLHGFEGDSSGPMHVPGIGPVPGTSVTNHVSADALGMGVTVQY